MGFCDSDRLFVYFGKICMEPADSETYKIAYGILSKLKSFGMVNLGDLPQVPDVTFAVEILKSRQMINIWPDNSLKITRTGLRVLEFESFDAYAKSLDIMDPERNAPDLVRRKEDRIVERPNIANAAFSRHNVPSSKRRQSDMKKMPPSTTWKLVAWCISITVAALLLIFLALKLFHVFR